MTTTEPGARRSPRDFGRLRPLGRKMLSTLARPRILIFSVLVAGIFLLAIPLAVACYDPVTKTGHTKETVDVKGGGRFTVRATRLSPRQVRVTLKLVVSAKQRSQGSFLAGPCTTGGCIDTGTRGAGLFPLGRERTTVVRTITLRRRYQGAIACVMAWAYDRGPDGGLSGGVIGELKVCPPLATQAPRN